LLKACIIKPLGQDKNHC